MDARKLVEKYFILNGLSLELIDRIQEKIAIRKYNAGTLLLSAGENTQVVCLVLCGAVRGYFIDEEGNENTKCFSFENQWCCVYNLLRKEPSEFWIETLEDCMVAEIAVKEIEQLLNSEEEWMKFYCDLCSKALMQSDHRGVSFQQKVAADRYREFKKKYSAQEGRIQQQYIASYLGITPSSLSRIKRNL